MASVTLRGDEIVDWLSFHRQSKEVFGFPDFYGENMDAWIDCLTCLDEGDGMSKFHLRPGEELTIEVIDCDAFQAQVPEIFDALVECTEFVNERYIEDGKKPTLSLVFK